MIDVDNSSGGCVRDVISRVTVDEEVRTIDEFMIYLGHILRSHDVKANESMTNAQQKLCLSSLG